MVMLGLIYFAPSLVGMKNSTTAMEYDMESAQISENLLYTFPIPGNLPKHTEINIKE